MNILFIKHFFVGFMVSEIPRVTIVGYCPYSVTFPYRLIYIYISLLLLLFLFGGVLSSHPGT